VNPFGELHELFATSVGAAAALIGLLFVAISLAPEKTFGENADPLRRAHAERAFTALGNVFFVSLAALLPHTALGAVAVIAFLAIVQIVGVGLRGRRSRAGSYNWREFGLLSLGIYGLELALAVRSLVSATTPDGVVYVIFGLYGYALSTAWNLLGAKDPAKPS
jgi:carbon starvation protein CstA